MLINSILHKQYAIFLSVLLLAEIGFCGLAFVLKDKGWVSSCHELRLVCCSQ